MLATVTLNGFVFASEFFSCPFQGIQWLIMQRMVRGNAHTYALESFDGYVIHTL
jgi:hypothetical protein